MRSFSCRTCGQLVFFDNDACLSCGASLGYEPRRREVISLLMDADDPSTLVEMGTGERFARCANEAVARCNWLVPAERRGDRCESCVLTSTRPADDDTGALLRFADAEEAKRHLLFQLGELGLPVGSPAPAGTGPTFDLLSSRDGPVTIGHADGLITLDLDEADPAHRERIRLEMGETYRTLLGHLRHEIGHYYWPVMVTEADGTLGTWRERFGDERVDYGESMDRHYREGPPPDWAEGYVSAYATMHPWEDWAETFAHYLHIRDTLQTAAAFGMVVDGPAPTLRAEPTDDVADQPFRAVIREWLPLTYALNAVNRSMGRPDLYPFVLAPRVIDKLSYVHGLLARR